MRSEVRGTRRSTSCTRDAPVRAKSWTPYPPELLSLYRSTRRQVDARKRLALLADLQQRVRDWAPVVSLYQEKKAYAHSTRVLQFVPTQELNMDFRGVALRR